MHRALATSNRPLPPVHMHDDSSLSDSFPAQTDPAAAACSHQRQPCFSAPVAVTCQWPVAGPPPRQQGRRLDPLFVLFTVCVILSKVEQTKTILFLVSWRDHSTPNDCYRLDRLCSHMGLVIWSSVSVDGPSQMQRGPRMMKFCPLKPDAVQSALPGIIKGDPLP